MNKTKVYQAYDQISDWFDEHREKGLIEKKYLDMIVNAIPKGGSILDLGCGTGEPIAKYFIEKGYQLTGIDGSNKMIALCQKRFPKQRWIEADMRNLALNQRFDAIIAWHSFFHLQHDDQRAMFKTFNAHIKPDAILIFTSGTDHDEVWSDNGGQDLFHASLSTTEYQQLLTNEAFEIITHNIADPECGGATVWIVKKSNDNANLFSTR